MSHYERSSDVYQELVEQSGLSWHLGLLAFAIVEEQRIEWERHFAKLNGRPPQAADVEQWYRALPPTQLLRAQGSAEDAINALNSALWEEFRSSEREQVRNEAIVQEIRFGRRLLPQFGINVASGLISAFLFALILLGLVLIMRVDPSPVDLGRTIFDGNEVEGER